MLGRPGVHLLRRTGMERERRRARFDEPRAELETGARAVLDSTAQLDRDRDVDGLGDRLDDAGGEVGLFEEVCARARARHLPHGTAEVEVDDVCADRLHHAGCIGHRSRLGAEELDRQRMLVRGNAEVAERPLVAVLDPRAAHHLGAHEPGAVPAALAPERLHADAGHWRENEACGHLDSADLPRGAEVDHGGSADRRRRLTFVLPCSYDSRPFDGAGGPRHPVSGGVL